MLVDSQDYGVIKKHGTSVSKLRKENGQNLLAHVTALIYEVYQVVTVMRKPDEEGMVLIAKALIKDYYFLKIEEFGVVMSKGMRGQYGKIYDRLSLDTFFDWFRCYDTDDKKIAYNENKAADFKKDEDKGRNVSILESEEFRKKVSKNIAKPIQKYTEEELKEHRENVRKQADNILNSE